ncbi:MAG: L-lactate permease [Rubrivivax sp.]|nr:L-lactate permease [Rubrivivax sp.]
MSGEGGTALAAALAAAPIAAILLLMLGPGWSAARAGLAALVLALPLAWGAFGFGSGPASSAAAALGGIAAEASFLAATILWILWPALALHALQQSSGALDTLRGALAGLTPRPALQALLVGWFVALFLEGAAGFGTPIALAAPLLVGLGVPPLQAVVLALLGHAAGVSFGALGTPVLAQVGLTGLDAGAIAWRTALLHALLGPLLMVFFVRTLAASGQAPGLAWPALAAAAFLLPALVLAALLGPEMPTLGAALLGGALFAWALRRAPAAPAQAPAAGVGRALAPYLLLVALVLATRAVPPLADVLGALRLGWGFGGEAGGGARFSGSVQPLTHPGTLLFVSLLAGALWQRVPAREVGQALAGAARRLLPVSVALLAMLALARLMLHAGMVDALQQAAVQGLGSAWPLLAPALGALGSFVTGSATASNVLFTTLQVQTAEALALPAAALAAAQGFGAAVGNIVCPHNIVAGAATVGLAGREALVLRHTLGPCLLYLAAGGVLVALLLRGPWAA